ncbi:MAG: hypothetical protein AABY22_23045, partial [Nanoarchaeota archaeon]
MSIDTNLKKIEKLLAVVDEDTLTRKEFIDAFEKVINFVLANEKKLSDAIYRLEETHKMLMDKMHSDYASRHSELKG